MKETFQLSLYQRTILDYVVAYPNTGIGNFGGLLKCNRKLSHEIMEKSFNEYLKNHKTMRLQLSNEYRLYVKEYEPFSLPIYDFSDKTEEEIKQMAKEWMSEPFSLFHSKLYWICMIKKGDEYYLFEKNHHLIMDGLSSIVGIQYQEYYYNQILNREAIKIEEKEDKFIQMLREKQWYSQRQYEEARQWFLERYKEIEPKWLLKQNSISPHADTHKIVIRQSLREKIISYCRENKITEEGFYYSTLYAYIAKLKGIDEVAIGRVLAGRSRKEKDMLGMMVNTVPVKLAVKRGCKFSELCQAMDIHLIGTLRHGSYDLHSLLKECTTKERIFDIAVSYRRNKYIPQTTFGTFEELLNGYLELPLRIFINEKAEGMEWILQFQKECYTEEEIKYLENRIINIMEQGVCNPVWNKISIFSEKDTKIINHANQTEKLNIEQTPTEIFLKRVEETPDKIALLYKKKKMSYQEVNHNSKKMAKAMQEKGVKEKDVVGLLMERNMALPICILAILRVGATFLPISPRDHEKRIEEIEESCKLIITDKMFQGRVKRIHYETLLQCNMNFHYEEKDGDINAVAYRMYTSGTTGNPKAVEITRKSLLCRLEWMWKEISCKGTIMQKTVYTFDVSIWEILLPLLYGATMSILPEGEEKYPDKIVETVEEHQVDAIHFVPSMLVAFIQYCQKKEKNLPMLKNIICSGEALQPTQVQQAYQIFPKSKIYNLYGPTECTIDVTYHSCKKKEKEIPIGLPVANTKIYICNQLGEEVPLGMEGEMVVTGDLVGKGYFGIEDKSYGYFREERAYWTGDLAKRGFDGLLYYIGRKDSQHKLRGMRINLKSIEAIMLEAGAREAAVIIKGQRLIAYYSGEKELDLLWENINKRLPYYSIPSKYIWIEKMPVGKNGKLDKKVLEEKQIESEHEKLPTTLKETILCRIISKQLKEIRISTDENLFEAGLDSLSILEIVNNLETEGISLTYMDFYENPTISKLAKICQQKKKETLQYLRKEDHKTLIICVPYAGAGPEVFYPLLKEMEEMSFDMASLFLENEGKCSAKEIGRKIGGQIQNYDKYYIVGYCVGSVVALEVTRFLLERGRKIEGLMLCGVLPGKKNPWKFLNDTSISKVLSYLHREKMSLSKKQIQVFRKDTDRFFEYMNQRRNPLNCKFPVTLIYGQKDEITLNYGKKYKKWRQYIKCGFQIYQLKNARHFFIKTHKKTITSIIKRDLKRDTWI